MAQGTPAVGCALLRLSGNMVFFSELIIRQTSEESWCIFKTLFCENHD